MHVHRSGSVVSVLAPAKLNLFLEVLSRRADGFHEIETLMAPISLWDTLTFEATSTDQISLSCQWASRAGRDPWGCAPGGRPGGLYPDGSPMRRMAARFGKHRRPRSTVVAIAIRSRPRYQPKRRLP